MIFHCFLWPNQKRPVENQDSKWITINVTGIQGQHILSQIITFGGTSFSCLSQELWSNLSSRLVMRGGGAGVSDVGSEFCRGIGGRWGDRPSWKAETPWEDWSCSDWDPVMEGPWDFTETRCAIWKENSEVSVFHNISVSLKTDQEVRKYLRLYRAVHGRRPGLLYASTAEGLWAGRQGGIRNTIGHFVLESRRALAVQLGAFLNLTDREDVSVHATLHNQSVSSLLERQNGLRNM